MTESTQYPKKALAIAAILGSVIVLTDFWIPAPLNPTPIQTVLLFIVSFVYAFRFFRHYWFSFMFAVVVVPFLVHLSRGITGVVLGSGMALVIYGVKWTFLGPAVLAGSVLGILVGSVWMWLRARDKNGKPKPDHSSS